MSEIRVGSRVSLKDYEELCGKRDAISPFCNDKCASRKYGRNLFIVEKVIPIHDEDDEPEFEFILKTLDDGMVYCRFQLYELKPLLRFWRKL